jgi:Zn-dependent protease
MKWSWKAGRLAGIDVYVHGTFVLFIAFVLVTEWTSRRSLAAAIAGVTFLLAIFATVVLHELGHALTARRFGVRTRDITLLPIGGIARLERMPDVPRQELWVALAGPAVNVVLAVVFGVARLLATGSPPRLTFNPFASPIDRFIAVNVSLAAFNMLPAFPMDGGRALRAVLAERMDYVRATEVAATLGQGLALVFGLVGVLGNPLLLFIALFVWMGASGEASVVGIRTALAGIPVSRAMVTDFRALDAGDSLQSAVQLVLAGSQRDFPVLEGTRLVGVLTRDSLVSALRDRGVTAPVREVMTSEFETADARECSRRHSSACRTASAPCCRCSTISSSSAS